MISNLRDSIILFKSQRGLSIWRSYLTRPQEKIHLPGDVVLKIGSMISSEERISSGQSLEIGINDVLNFGGVGQLYSFCEDEKQSSLSKQA